MKRWGPALAVAVLSLGCRSGRGPEAHDTAAAGPTASLRGVAYQLRSHLPLEGVEIGVVEDPELSVFTDEEGRFELGDLARGQDWTPWALAPGHALTHHQRFKLQSDVEPLYFQLVPDDLYRLMVTLVEGAGLPLDPGACQVVSTIGDPSLAQADGWEAFLERGDAGLVAGATAEIEPAAGTRLYFNELVLPDPTQSASTTDGGVLWVNVPPGAYRLSAHDPSGRYQFPEVEVGCEPGWLVNASPPWGLTARP